MQTHTHTHFHTFPCEQPEKDHSWFQSSNSGVGADAQDASALDLAGLHLVQNCVNLLELPFGNSALDLARAGDGQAVVEVLAGADDGASDGLSVQDHGEDVHGEAARGQRNADGEAHGPDHVDTLSVGLRLGGQDDRAVGADAVTHLLDGRNHLLARLALNVDEAVAAQSLHGVLLLVLSKVDSADLQAHGLGVLASDVAETTAGTHDGDPLSCFCLRLLQSLVGGDTGTEDGCCLNERQAIRDLAHIGGLSQGVFRKAALSRKPSLVLLTADSLPAREAVVASTTGVVQPGVSDTVTDSQSGHPLTKFDDDTRTLMTRNDGEFGFHMPIAITHVKIGVADTRADDLDQDLSVARLWDGNILEGKGFTKSFHHSSLHHFRDGRHIVGKTNCCRWSWEALYGCLILET
mmetsp:Transcript_76980/g.168267  ORF Transcript_76980/g.168267 Transcript_76980/m.168267 type:complete len:407 (+) Transcript_76980:307-1527(+)